MKKFSDDVRERAEQHERTNFFFGLPMSSVSRLIPKPSPKSKLRKNEVLVSSLKPGDIVADVIVPWSTSFRHTFHFSRGSVAADGIMTEKSVIVPTSLD